LAGTWILLAAILISAGDFANAAKNARIIHLNWWEYLRTEPGVILYYLRLSAWPHPLCLDRDWPIVQSWTSVLPPAFVLAVLTGATGWALRRNSAWGLTGTWFFLILAPTSSFVPLQSPLFEHRMYLPLAAVVVLAVLGLYWLAGRQSLVVCGLAVIGLTYVTSQRNLVYRSQIALWSDAVAEFPNNPSVHDRLAVALGDAGQFPEAIGHWQEALRLLPDYAAAQNDPRLMSMQLVRLLNNMAVVLMKMGRLPEAIAHEQEAVRLDPNNLESHYNLGQALWQAGAAPAAIEQWEIAVRIKPDNVEAHYNLGIALEQVGRRTEAIQHFRQALQIRPGYAEAYNNLGSALWRAGDFQEARKCYEQALRLKPGLAEAHYNLGGALEHDGAIPEAIAHYEQALRLNPNLVEARNRLTQLRATR